MSQTIYFVFNKGQQPLQSEMDELDGHLAALGGFVVGRDQYNNSLTFAFEKEAFNRHRKRDFNFSKLIESWEEKGRVKEYLQFNIDPAALQPIDDVTEIVDKREHARQETTNARERTAISMAEAKMRLEKLKDNINRVGEVSKFVPWLLGLMVASGTVYTGYRIGKAVSDIEPRRDTVQRVIDDPMNANLKTGNKKDRKVSGKDEPASAASEEHKKEETPKDAVKSDTRKPNSRVKDSAQAPKK